MPDVVILLDVLPEVGLERTREKQGTQKDRWDDLERLSKIREAYHEIAGDDFISRMVRIAMFSGSAPRHALREVIFESVESLVGGICP